MKTLKILFFGLLISMSLLSCKKDDVQPKQPINTTQNDVLRLVRIDMPGYPTSGRQCVNIQYINTSGQEVLLFAGYDNRSATIDGVDILGLFSTEMTDCYATNVRYDYEYSDYINNGGVVNVTGDLYLHITDIDWSKPFYVSASTQVYAGSYQAKESQWYLYKNDQVLEYKPQIKYYQFYN